MPPWEEVLRRFVAQYLGNPDALIEALMRQQLHIYQTLNDGEVLCKKGDPADCLWLIIDGAIVIRGENGAAIRQRRDGELIGEQAFFLERTPSAQEKGRSAEMSAHGHTTLLRFDGTLADKLTLEQRYLWYEMLANVVNAKLVEATRQRSELTSKLHWHTDLVRKFGDTSALGVVMLGLTGGPPVTPERQAVVWFSDIAGFSAWSQNLSAAIVGGKIKELIGLQMSLIRRYGGEIDKIAGDGLMAYWFCDGHNRETTIPLQSLVCAQQVVSEFQRVIDERGPKGLSLRIGLHCGPVCFGDFGTENRVAVTILGSTVNLAARFEQIHEPTIGRIRMSEAMQRRIASEDSAMATSLKGPVSTRVKSDDLIVYWI